MSPRPLRTLAHSELRTYFKKISLLDLILFIPDIFKDYLIFESNKIEDFDIGTEELWLKVRTTELNPRKIYSVHRQKPEPEADCKIIFYEKCWYQKPKNLNGIIHEPGCYNHRIKQKLETFKPINS